jgi:predicted secreted Zn-dependent protease
MMTNLTQATLLVTAIAMLATAPIEASNAQSQPKISINTNYYQIKGGTAAQLRNEMNRVRPFDRFSNGRYDALTRWYITGNYKYIPGDSRCQIYQPQVFLMVKTTLPKWNPTSKANPKLVRKWRKYIKVLRLHENGHKQNGIEAARELQKSLSQIPSYSSCQSLATAVKELSQKITTKYNQKDLEYDRQTKHGATQGAIFP